MSRYLDSEEAYCVYLPIAEGYLCCLLCLYLEGYSMVSRARPLISQGFVISSGRNASRDSALFTCICKSLTVSVDDLLCLAGACRFGTWKRLPPSLLVDRQGAIRPVRCRPCTRSAYGGLTMVSCPLLAYLPSSFSLGLAEHAVENETHETRQVPRMCYGV